MPTTVDTVERERESYSREISFFSDAQKTVFVNTKEVGLNNKVTSKKDGLYSKESLLYSLSFFA